MPQAHASRNYKCGKRKFEKMTTLLDVIHINWGLYESLKNFRFSRLTAKSEWKKKGWLMLLTSIKIVYAGCM